MSESGEVTIRVVTDAKNLDELRQGMKQWQTELNSSDFGSAQFQQAQQKVGEFKTAIKDATGAGQGMHQTYFQLGTLIREVGTAWMAWQAALQAFKGAEVAAQFDLMNTTLDNFAKKDGTSAKVVMDQIREATNGTVSEVDMLKAALKFRMQDVPFAQIPELMQIADERSKLFGVDFETASQAILSASLGITRSLKTQLGISVDAKTAEAEYAKTLGISADQLSEVGKRHAILNGIIIESNRQNLQMNKEAEAQVDTWEQMKAALSNVALAFGHLLGVFTPVIGAITWIVDLLKLSIEEITLFVKVGYDAITGHFQQASTDMGALNTKAQEVMAKLKEGWKAVTVTVEGDTKATKENTKAHEDRHAALIKGTQADINQSKVQEAATTKAKSDRLAGFKEELAAITKHQLDINKIQGENEQARLAAAKKEAQQQAQVYTQMGQSVGSQMAQGITQGVPVLHAAFKAVLDEILSFIEKQLLAAIFENTAKMFGTLGPVGLVIGATESAAITALFDVAKAEIKSFAAGGMIYEPVVGRGLQSGSIYTIAEQQPEYVSPIHDGRYGGAAGQMQPSIRIFPIADNQQIAVMVEYGNRALAQRRIQ